MGQSVKTYKASQLPSEYWDVFHEIRGQQDAYANPFFDPDFARLISDVRRDVTIAVAEDDEGVVAFWPMHVSFSKKARGLGGPFSDRNGPVVRSGKTIDAPQFLAASGVAGYRTSGMIVSQQVGIGKMDSEEAYGSNLAEGWNAFLAEQNGKYPKFFKKMRRLERKLENEHANVVFTFDNKSDADFELLIAMKKEQYDRTNLHDVLGPLWANEMIEKLRSGYCPGLKTILSTIHADGKLIAAEFNIQSGALLHGWLVGYDPKFSKYSPGNMVMKKILEHMPEQGLTYYDSGTGSGHYKKYFTNAQHPVGNGMIFTEKHTLNLMKLMGLGFGFVEEKSTGRISTLLSRIRRRSEQIICTELKLNEKIKGFVRAISPSSFRMRK